MRLQRAHLAWPGWRSGYAFRSQERLIVVRLVQFNRATKITIITVPSSLVSDSKAAALIGSILLLIRGKRLEGVDLVVNDVTREMEELSGQFKLFCSVANVG